MIYTPTAQEHITIKSALEQQNPNYTVTSYKVERIIPTDQGDRVVVLQNIRLEGKHMLSDDGKMDGQPIPMILADEHLPWAGYLIKL
jgi:hypothetical protein